MPHNTFAASTKRTRFCSHQGLDWPWTPAEKAAIVAAARSIIRKGENCKNIAPQLGVNQPSLRGWPREATLNMLYPPLPPCMPRNRSAS